jgi:hypothetical protein
MGKHSYKSKRKDVERFTTWHGLGILVVIQGHSARAPIAVDARISALRRALSEHNLWLQESLCAQQVPTDAARPVADVKRG